jgi:hypothetical protein
MTPIPVLESVWNSSLPSISSDGPTAGAGIDLVNLAAFAAMHRGHWSGSQPDGRQRKQ